LKKLSNKNLSNKISRILEDAVFNYNRRNLSEATELFRAVLEDDPVNPEANYYLGIIYSKDEKWTKAVVHFKAVVDMESNFLYTQQCRMLLGYIYFKNKDYKRAEAEFLYVLDSNVNIVQVYAALAAIKYHLGEKDEALMYAEKACDIDNYNLNAKNTYGYFLCDYEVDIPKGLEMLREVVRIKPANPAYLDSLGWAYYKKGDKKAALASLKKASEIAGSNLEIKEHIREVYNG